MGKLLNKRIRRNSITIHYIGISQAHNVIYTHEVTSIVQQLPGLTENKLRVYFGIRPKFVNPRTPRGVGTTPWRFSPVTFLMIPTAKIASSYLLLGMRDTFWHMWHHLDAVTEHMSWRHMYMTVVKIHCFYHCLLIEISSDVDAIK